MSCRSEKNNNDDVTRTCDCLCSCQCRLSYPITQHSVLIKYSLLAPSPLKISSSSAAWPPTFPPLSLDPSMHHCTHRSILESTTPFPSPKPAPKTSGESNPVSPTLVASSNFTPSLASQMARLCHSPLLRLCSLAVINRGVAFASCTLQPSRRRCPLATLSPMTKCPAA